MSAHLVAAMGWALLHFVWEGALIGCAAGILLTALRNARPETRYALACAALLLCLAWPLADLVLMLYRPDMYPDAKPEDEGKAELIVAKQRNGPTGTVHLAFLKQHTRFEDMARGN